MEAYLELDGSNFDVDAALAGSSLREHAKIFYRGEKGELRGTLHQLSGFQIWIGGDEGVGLEQQIAEAIGTLAEDADEIRRIRTLPGVERARLRLGEIWRPRVVAHTTRLPSELLLICGQLGLEIAVCNYLGEEETSHDGR